MPEPLLELRGVNKSFGPVQVLHDVNFKVYPGQVTALVGDNGAGKSTLVKTIAGIYRADSGEFRFEGKPVTIHGPKEAADLGIEVVYQDLALCDNLDIVQNMFLGRERRSGIVLNECAQTAQLLFGGNGYTKSGQGELVERIYREVPGVRIPGGSEDVMLDLGVRQLVKNFKNKTKALERPQGSSKL